MCCFWTNVLLRRVLALCFNVALHFFLRHQPPYLTIGSACERVELCSHNTCHNGGTCMEDHSGGVHCVCPEDRTGSYCENPISCVDRPCMHASSCQDYVSIVHGFCFCWIIVVAALRGHSYKWNWTFTAGYVLLHMWAWLDWSELWGKNQLVQWWSLFKRRHLHWPADGLLFM